MSRMIRMLLGAVVVMMVSVSGVWADGDDKDKKDHKAFNPERMLGATIDVMKEKLGLSEEQVAKLKNLAQETQKKFEELRAKAEGGDHEGMREEMQKIRTSLMDQVKSILTDEQKAKFKEFAEGKRKEIGDRMKGGLMNLKALHEKLNLSEEQENEIKEVLAGVREEMKRIREESQGDGEKAREAMKGVFEKVAEEIKSVLNDEQKQIFEQMQKEMREKRKDREHKDKEKN